MIKPDKLLDAMGPGQDGYHRKKKHTHTSHVYSYKSNSYGIRNAAIMDDGIPPKGYTYGNKEKKFQMI